MLSRQRAIVDGGVSLGTLSSTSCFPVPGRRIFDDAAIRCVTICDGDNFFCPQELQASCRPIPRKSFFGSLLSSNAFQGRCP